MSNNGLILFIAIVKKANKKNITIKMMMNIPNQNKYSNNKLLLISLEKMELENTNY